MEDSIGAVLRRSREQRRLTISQVSEITRVRPHFLQALEDDDLSAIPSAAQARGFLRIYAEFLGLEIAKLIPALEPPESAAAPIASEAAEVARGKGASSALGGQLARLRQRLSQPPRSRPSPQNAPASDSSSEDGEFHAGDDGSASGPTELGPLPPARPTSTVAVESSDLPKTPVRAEGDEPELPSGPPEAAMPRPEAASSPSKAPGVTGDVPGATPALHGAGISTRLRWVSSFLSRLFSRPSKDLTASAPAEDSASSFFVEESDSGSRPTAPGDGDEQFAEDAEGTAQPSDEIFAEIGRQLRERREMLSLTQEEIERHTHVKAEFLEGLELGALDELPSLVHTRGILANYAAFLDLDVDTVLLRFADGLQARHREHRPQWQPPRTRPSIAVHTSLPPVRSFIASDLIFGVGVAIVLLLFAVWGISRVMTIRTSTQARATSPSISDILAGTSVATVAQEVTLIAAQDTPLAPTADTAAGVDVATLDPNVAVQITLTTSEQTYMRITVDGKVAFEGRAEPGKDYTYQGARQIEVLVGNASALRVTYNGRDAGLMGSFGQVVDRIYTVQGVFTPTATLPPTPTPSPNLTATPSVTPTTTPSATATQASGG